jgi:flagellar hook-associated protein 2
MVSSTNLNLSNSLKVDPNGTVSFSGLSSGIDWQGAVDSIMAARQVPVDSLKTKVTDNDDKVKALQTLTTDLQALQSSLSSLYGAVTFQNAGNIFEAKQAFASTSRLDGQTPNAANNLVGVTVTNAATTGEHSIEVLRLAQAQKISSDAFASTTTALGLTDGDSFTINGTAITVTSADTLADLRDRINAADTGASPTGVSASIVSVGTNENYLILTKDATGQPMTIADATGTPLQTLGILNSGGAVKNQLQAAQTAEFYADGLLDQSNTSYETAFHAASTDTIGSAGQLTFTDSGTGTTLGTVNYNAGDSLSTLASNINAAGLGVTATIVQDGAGVRLDIKGSSAFTFSETGGGSAIDDLGLTNSRKIIQRDTNTISDLYAGVTLSLFGAEPGTTVKLSIEKNLSQVVTSIQGFVTAYNALRTFINQNRLIDTNTGEKSADAGVLFDSNALQDVTTALTAILGGGSIGTTPDYSALGQIGLSFVDINTTDPTTANTLQLDQTTLENALENNPSAVQQFFGFSMASSDPRVTLLGFDSHTTYSATGYTLNVNPGTSANIGGAADGSDNGTVSMNGDALTVTSGGAQGLKLFANGLTGPTTVTVNYSIGIGAQMYFAIQGLLDQTTGSVPTEIGNLNDQNDLANDRINEMLDRLDIQRQDLLKRFQNMETSLSTSQNLMDSLKQMTQSMFGNSSSSSS